MNLMLLDNYRMAINSIRRSRLRSLLTMLGIIIAVVSVITIVSLGEGVKNQVSGQIGKLGSDLIAVYPGKLVERNADGEIVGVNLLSTLGRGTLSEADLEAIASADNINRVAPMSLVTGTPETDRKATSSTTIIATSADLAEIINREVAFGSFLQDGALNGNSATIGRDVARDFFGENIPIGKTITIRDQQFVVQGVFDRFETPNPVNPTLNFNNTVFINYETAKEMPQQPHIFQILAQTDDATSADESVTSINEALMDNYDGEENFTVLQQDETLEIAQNVVSLVTSLVAGIAAVSLLIGGIGIMNIMLVSVSERDREIGIRKAVGASNRQIRSQFLIEAIVLSVWGAMIGLVVSGLINLVIRVMTDLTPVITLPVVVAATGVAVIVGTIFGLAPAIKASMKDPIESLRRL